MTALGKLRNSFLEGKFDSRIAKLVKLCNVILLVSTILSALSIVLMPVALSLEPGLALYIVVFIIYAAFYMCLFGAIPAIVAVIVLSSLFKFFRTMRLDTARTQKLTILLIIFVIICVIAGFALLASGWY